MFTIPTETIEETEIEDVLLHHSNLGDHEDFEKFFYRGYWQINVSSTGKNPSFPPGMWAFILLAPRQEESRLELNLPFIPLYIPRGSMIEKVSTRIDIQELNGDLYAIPALYIDIASKIGPDVIKVQCGEIEVVTPPDRSRLN